MSEQLHPRIGTAVWVRKDSKVLLGVRNSRTGTGTWCPPGGHLEMNEPTIECAIRETREEASIELENVKFITTVDNIWKEMGSHFVTLYYVADWKSGEPVPQPVEFDKWDWFSWENLPQPLFQPAQLFVDTGLNPLNL